MLKNSELIEQKECNRKTLRAAYAIALECWRQKWNPEFFSHLRGNPMKEWAQAGLAENRHTFV